MQQINHIKNKANKKTNIRNEKNIKSSVDSISAFFPFVNTFFEKTLKFFVFKIQVKFETYIQYIAIRKGFAFNILIF